MNPYPSTEQLAKIKYIISDLDGTLYAKKGKVSDATIAKLLALQAKGYIVIIATGRYYYEIEGLVQSLQLARYGGYAICCNGATIYNCRTHQTIPFPKLTKSELIKLTHLAKQHGVSTYVNFANHYEFVPCKLHHAIVTMSKLLLYPAKLMLSDTHKISRLYRAKLTHTLNENIESLPKICFIATSKKLASYQTLVKKLEAPYAYYPSGSMALEITHESVGKHIAVKKVLSQNKDTLDTVIFFGDSGNDKPLLAIAGIGVAMKNAEKDCLKAAHFINPYTNKEDGVLAYLNKLELL